MPTARPTTIKMSSAVRRKSLRTSGKRAFSTATTCLRGTGVAPATVVRASSVCEVNSVFLRARRLVRLAFFIEMLREPVAAAVDRQRDVRNTGGRNVKRTAVRDAALFVPRDDLVFAGRNIGEIEVAARVGEAVERRRHHLNHRRHARMNVAVNADDTRRSENVRFAPAGAIESEIECVAGGQREKVVRDWIFIRKV